MPDRLVIDLIRYIVLDFEMIGADARANCGGEFPWELSYGSRDHTRHESAPSSMNGSDVFSVFGGDQNGNAVSSTNNQQVTGPPGDNCIGKGDVGGSNGFVRSYPYIFTMDLFYLDAYVSFAADGAAQASVIFGNQCIMITAVFFGQWAEVQCRVGAGTDSADSRGEGVGDARPPQGLGTIGYYAIGVFDALEHGGSLCDSLSLGVE